MHILVIGAAGMVGRKFVEKLARDGTLGGKPVSRITAFDVVAATPPEASFPIDVHTGDFPESGMAEALITDRPDIIVHLACDVTHDADGELGRKHRYVSEVLEVTPGERPRGFAPTRSSPGSRAVAPSRTPVPTACGTT